MFKVYYYETGVILMDENYLVDLGLCIKNIRKIRKLTVQELADKIHKSKATVSKYENGGISLDILTLNEIAMALNISLYELLPKRDYYNYQKKITKYEEIPSFFRNNKSIYAYYYDGRNKSIIESVLIIEDQITDGKRKVIMYMNIEDINYPQACENSYIGNISHYDVITRINLDNRDTLIEKSIVTILSPFIETDERWGLWTGISIRPIMPASVKMLFTRNPIEKNDELKQKILINKRDINNIEFFNMFSIF